MKEEQIYIKNKLAELTEYMNSEEYYSLPSNEKSNISIQKLGMEIYLKALNNRLYNKQESIDMTSLLLMLPLLMPFTSGITSSKSQEFLEKSLKEEKN